MVCLKKSTLVINSLMLDYLYSVWITNIISVDVHNVPLMNLRLIYIYTWSLGSEERTYIYHDFFQKNQHHECVMLFTWIKIQSFRKFQKILPTVKRVKNKLKQAYNGASLKICFLVEMIINCKVIRNISLLVLMNVSDFHW